MKIEIEIETPATIVRAFFARLAADKELERIRAGHAPTCPSLLDPWASRVIVAELERSLAVAELERSFNEAA